MKQPHPVLDAPANKPAEGFRVLAHPWSRIVHRESGYRHNTHNATSKPAIYDRGFSPWTIRHLAFLYLRIPPNRN